MYKRKKAFEIYIIRFSQNTYSFLPVFLTNKYVIISKYEQVSCLVGDRGGVTPGGGTRHSSAIEDSITHGSLHLVMHSPTADLKGFYKYMYINLKQGIKGQCVQVSNDW